MKIETLSKEAWINAAEHIESVASAIAVYLKRINHDGMGEQDAEEFLIDMQFAYTAMRYVAEFASDKCKFILM